VTITDLLLTLDVAGIRLVNICGQLRVRGPAGAIVPALREALAEHKPALLAMLPAGRNSASDEGTRSDGVAQLAAVTISGQEYPYRQRWRGERMEPRDHHLAFDTETEVVDLQRQIPRLALATASAGKKDNALIHPDDLGAFILVHKELHFVCHNATFDFWVVEQHLRERQEEEARKAWWSIVDTGRLHDSMILDSLVRLARDDSYPDPRDLATVAKQYVGMEISKDDPYRKRYAEIIGQDWTTIEEGFPDYAIRDAIATLPTYLAIAEQASALEDQFAHHDTDILPDAVERFGLLTEAIQVKKAIALTQIQRNGQCLDHPRLMDAEADLRQRLAGAVARARELCPELYKIDKEGALKLTAAGVPSKSNAALVAKLQQVAEGLRQAGTDLSIPVTPKARKASIATEFWAEYADLDPFLRNWVEVEELAKMVQFFGHLQDGRIHPHYQLLKRSGRTSCRNPNVQQIPRDGPLRSAFVASPGYLLLAVDYAFLELRTFAATALHRYGWSDMAEIIKAGVDPHAHTAALMLNVPLEEFLSWKSRSSFITGRT
jgi:DNA polymerase I-like protein with 3'-5' exonuclease and polymerase domains